MYTSIFENCLPIIEKYAPLIATALGFPNAGAIAFDILTQIFDLKNKPITEGDKIINESEPQVLQEAEGKFLDWAKKNLPEIEIEGKIKFDWN